MSSNSICIIGVFAVVVCAFPAGAMDTTYMSYLGGAAPDGLERVVSCGLEYYLIGRSSSGDLPIEITGYQTEPYSYVIPLPYGFVLQCDDSNRIVTSTLFAGNYSEYPEDMKVLESGVVTAWSSTSRTSGELPESTPAWFHNTEHHHREVFA